MLVRQLPSSSRLALAQHGDAVRWGDSEYLLAGIFDLLAGANWQRSGGKSQRPKPTRRPGGAGETRYGKAIPIDLAKERLKRRRTGAAAS